jgi:hypothetical protein
MNRFLKTLLISILIVVLPLKAVAASVGMSCAPGHLQAMQVAMSHADATSDDAEHHHAHDESSSVGSAASVSDNAVAGDAELMKPSPHSPCSGCSAFCMGAAAPPPVSLSIPSFGGSEDLIVSAEHRVSGFIPEGLRRPPRQIPA